VIKCVAVSPGFQSEGLAARIVSGLVGEAARNGVFHLFLFTKPENEALFGGLGFYPVAKTADALLMENRKDGVAAFVAALEKPEPSAGRRTGSIVMNCNPFTLGHGYLAEQAAAECPETVLEREKLKHVYGMDVHSFMLESLSAWQKETTV
jgi:[citrate (pro-3S)-lyase] ligase